MSKRIALTCKEASNDRLIVSADGKDVMLSTEACAQETLIILDEERARALFNWLGVWLHGGNRS